MEGEDENWYSDPAPFQELVRHALDLEDPWESPTSESRSSTMKTDREARSESGRRIIATC